MENGRTNANGPGGHKNNRIGCGHAKQHQSQKRKGRGDGQGIGQRAAVRIKPDQRLQDGGRDMEHHGDHADLAKGERVGIAQDGIDGQHQGLQRVVDQVAGGDGNQHRKNGAAGNAVFDCGQAEIPECQAPLANMQGPCQLAGRKAAIPPAGEDVNSSSLLPAASP